MPQFADDIAACLSDARQVEGFGLVQLNRRRVGKESALARLAVRR
jgi:hypothetical protein